MKICHGSLAFLAFLEKNIKISVGIDIYHYNLRRIIILHVILMFFSKNRSFTYQLVTVFGTVTVD